MNEKNQLDIVNDKGRKFRVKIEAPSLHKNAHEPRVRFYDLTYAGDKFGPDGQFTGGGYYLSTLLAHSPGAGLDLMGYVREWKIDGKAMSQVLAWLRNQAAPGNRAYPELLAQTESQAKQLVDRLLE